MTTATTTSAVVDDAGRRRQGVTATGDLVDGRRTSGQRPRWGRWAQLSVAAVAGALYLSNLSVNGLANPYYAAAVKSGSVSWKAFLFGSLDPGSFITVDKPPAAFWVQALSVRVFGYSSWSLLVPEAVAGILTAVVVYHLARRLVLSRVADPLGAAGAVDAAGVTGVVGAEVAGVLAGLAVAVTPIAAMMFRFNDPDALLALLLVLAAWAGWVAIERGSVRRLVLAAFLIGLAFLAKELVAAVIVPGLALAWIIAAPLTWRRRLLGWLWSGLALVVSAGWWVALVQLWPASDRPYIGSSTNNSIVSVIFGYNGFSRLFGSHGRAGGGASGGAVRLFAGRGGGGGFGGGAGGFGGGAGWTRMFSTSLGSQISWLIPLAALGLVFGLLSAGRAPLRDRRRAGYVLWGGWGLAAWLVFSKSSGTFHDYYTVALAPPVALLAATGAVDLWAAGRRHRTLAWLLPAGVAGSGVWAYALLDRDASYHPWLRVTVVAAAAVGALGLLVAALLTSPLPSGPVAGDGSQPAPASLDATTPASGATSTRVAGSSTHPVARSVAVVAGVVASVALLAGPAAWSISSATHAGNGTNPTAGPASAATSSFSFGGAGRPGAGALFGGGTRDLPGGGRAGGLIGALGGAASSGPTAGDRTFVSWLEANRQGAKYLVAVDGSMSADDLIIASGQPVMAMGGFSGGDPDPTLGQFERLVSAGQVRYVLVGGGGGFGGGAGLGGFGGAGGLGALDGGDPGRFGGAGGDGLAGDGGATIGRDPGAGGFGAATGGRTTTRRGGTGLTVTAVDAWVEANGTKVPTTTWGGGVSGTLYEVTPATVSSARSSTQASITGSTIGS